MSLAEITLIEVVATNIDFTHNMLPQGAGEMKVEYGDLAFQGGFTVKDGLNTPVIIIHAAPEIKGYKNGGSEIDFSLKINMRMVYIHPQSIIIDEKFFQENAWYFSSILKIYFKFHADDILNKTAIRDLKLALN